MPNVQVHEWTVDNRLRVLRGTASDIKLRYKDKEVSLGLSSVALRGPAIKVTTWEEAESLERQQPDITEKRCLVYVEENSRNPVWLEREPTPEEIELEQAAGYEDMTAKAIAKASKEDNPSWMGTAAVAFIGIAFFFAVILGIMLVQRGAFS